MRIPADQPADSAESRGQRWLLRHEAEHAKQWKWFKHRWNDHTEAVSGPLSVQWAQLDREPPFAVVGSESAEEEVAVALGRDDARLRFIRTEGGRSVTLPNAARTLGVHPVQMNRAAAAILDGLEQSERIAGRTPVQIAPSDWVDLRRFDRFSDALEAGYRTAWSALEDEGINVDGMLPGAQLKLSEEKVHRFAVLGRSATANAAATLAEGDTAKDVMVAVEVLTGNPWDQSEQRAEVEERLDERLAGMGLHTVGRQTKADFDNARVRGIVRAGDQIGSMALERESAAAPRASGRSVREVNEERMARQVPARIRDEDSLLSLRPRSVRRS